MDNIIGVIGGDLRNVELVKILRFRGYEVKTYGLFENECCGLDEFLENTRYIVAGTPFSRDGEMLDFNGSKEKVRIEELFGLMSDEQVLFAGSISTKVREMASKLGVNVYDLLDDEDMAILNAIPSAEGAVEVALKSMKCTLHGSNCLVVGFGRIGKVIAGILKGFNANVYVSARKDSDLAWIKAMGHVPVKYCEMENYIGRMDVVFNTVPFLVLDGDELNSVDKKCVLIDLASKPGGINFGKANELGLEVYWALGLPGKVAPRSVACYMADKIIEKISK